MALVMTLDDGIPMWNSDDPRNQVLWEIHNGKGRIYGAARRSCSRGPKGGYVYTFYVYDTQGKLVLETRRQKDCRNEGLFNDSQFITQSLVLTRCAPVNIDPQSVDDRAAIIGRILDQVAQC